MRITTRIVLDIETYKVLEHEFYEYSGPWEYAKGEHSSAEQAAADQQRQQDFQIQQQQLAMQQRQFDMVNPMLQQIIQNRGMLPETQAALTAQLMNTLPQQYSNIAGQINNSLVSRGITGGDYAGSGDIARNYGALGASMAGQQQQGLLGIEEMKMQGLQGAMNTALGIGGQYGQNVGIYGGGASSALNSGVNAAYNADQAGTGFWGPIIGGALGMGASFIPKPKGTGCWIAAAIYGDESPEFYAARRFVFELWQGRIANTVRWLYIKVGPWLGLKARKHSLIRNVLRPLFDVAVKKGR